MKIVVVGATGNLGQRIVGCLTRLGVETHAVVRPAARPEAVANLEKAGAKIHEATLDQHARLVEVFSGAHCVVSALQGVEDVIVGAQLNLVEAAVEAGVPRFIPSDFSVNFHPLPEGGNRNFDLRRRFHQGVKGKNIRITSIFNGAFAEILAYGTPLLDPKSATAGYWGDKADWLLDFTTMDDTAEFTARAAMDDTAPAQLEIASFRISPRELAQLGEELTGREFSLRPMGSLADLDKANRELRSSDPASEQQVFPRWQQGQYMHDQFSTHHEHLHNSRYEGGEWTDARSFLRNILRS